MDGGSKGEGEKERESYAQSMSMEPNEELEPTTPRL